MIVESYEDIIVLSGDLRQNHWTTIHTAITLTLRRHPTGVVVDCSNLGTVTPDGAETFHDAMIYIREHKARIICAAVPEPVMEVLRQVPEVRSQLPVAPTVEAARSSLDLLWDNPEEDGKKRKKPTVSGTAVPMIVCLYVGTTVEEDNAAMKVASELADSYESVIHLVCALVVPRELPLTAPLSDQEASVRSAVERAQQYFDKKGIPHFDHLERGRDIASALAAAQDQIGAKTLVLPLRCPNSAMEANQKLVKSVLERIQQRIVFVRDASL